MEEERIRDSVMLRYHFELIVGWMLEKGREDPDARATALSLSKALAEGGDSTWVSRCYRCSFRTSRRLHGLLLGKQSYRMTGRRLDSGTPSGNQSPAFRIRLPQS